MPLLVTTHHTHRSNYISNVVAQTQTEATQQRETCSSRLRANAAAHIKHVAKTTRARNPTEKEKIQKHKLHCALCAINYKGSPEKNEYMRLWDGKGTIRQLAVEREGGEKPKRNCKGDGRNQISCMFVVVHVCLLCVTKETKETRAARVVPHAHYNVPPELSGNIVSQSDRFAVRLWNGLLAQVWHNYSSGKCAAEEHPDPEDSLTEKGGGDKKAYVSRAVHLTGNSTRIV